MNSLFEHYPQLETKIPWLPIGNYPTPIEPLPIGNDVFIKRDDRTSEIYGGNKVRKLEFLLADALARERHLATIVALTFLALFAALVWRLTNKPANVDFLIATDSEMKKVNWTSRKELFGSTRVVIVFMFLIATVLFVFDLFFGYFFYLIGVLHTPPF